MPPTLPARQRTDLLVAAHALADLAGAAILPYFRKPMKVENKHGPAGFDPVTRADKAAERAMRKWLAANLPEHGIIGEEYAARDGAGRYNWVLDPIDGTRAFIMGYPLWGVLIGLLDGDATVLGMMDQPFTRERFWAAGKGSHAQAPTGHVRRMATRRCARLADAILACTSPDMFTTDADRAAFAAVAERVRMTRFGGDCYAYCLLAAGHIDLIVEANLKAVDIVALIPIIEQAGGRVTTWEGRPATEGGRIVAAGDPALHAAALRRLGG